MSEPELVSSGGFRVDRAKALEKLREFQTPDPELFMLPWVRAAVSGGATRITMDLAKTGDFTMAFDGEPVAPDRADPSIALFGTAPDPRLRHLAVGLLAALRLRPKLVTLASGAGPRRRCLRLGPAGDSYEPQESDSKDTILWVIPWDGVPADHWHLKVLAACRACPVPLQIGATVVQPFAGEEADGLFLREGGRRIWVEPAEPRGRAFNVYHLGVAAGALKRRAAIPVSGFVDDPDLTLDASQLSAVRNDAYAAAAEAVDAAAEELAVHIAGTQRARLERLAGWLSQAKWRSGWERRMRGQLSSWPTGSPAPLELIEAAAEITLWLARLRRKALEPKAAKAVESCPHGLDDVLG